MKKLPIPAGYRQPQKTTSIETMLEFKKQLQALERGLSVFKSSTESEIKALTCFKKKVIKELYELQRELTNHLMNE